MDVARMLEFRTLGTIDLRAADGALLEEPLRHSKRVALLAYLSVAHPPRLHRRTTLASLLWPDLDESHSRGMLRHELYELRRALGREILTGDGGESLGVDGGKLWCDARAFEDAFAAGRLAEALALVDGELLPGLAVNGGAFDRWLDSARDGLTRHACEAAGRLSAGAEQKGNLLEAVRWARRWTDLVWHDEVGWRRLITLLDRVGDRAGALAAYDGLAARLQEELAVDPAPETQSLAREIRERRDSIDRAAGDPSRARQSAGPVPVRIAICPTANETGNPRHDALARRLTDHLTNGIAELDYVAVIDDEDAEAAAVVRSSLYRSAGRLEACTRVAESGEAGRVLAFPEPVYLDVSPDGESLDEVAARAMVAVAVRYDPRVPMAFVSGSPVRIPSWKAWLEFIQGSEAFGAFRFDEAAIRLQRANEIDPQFLKAGIFAAIAIAYGGDPARAEAVARQAVRVGGETATEYERHFAEWFLAGLTGRRAEAYRATRETVQLTDHPVIRFLAGREAYRFGRPVEALELLAGLESDYGWWRNWTEAYEVVGGALHILGDHQRELQEVLTGRERRPDSLPPFRAEVRARAALGDAVGTLEAVHLALMLEPDLVSPAEVAAAAAHELDAHGSGAGAAAAREAGLDWLASRSEPSVAEQTLEVQLLLESGNVTEAEGRLRPLQGTGTLEAIGLSGLLAAAKNDTAAADDAVARLESLDNPYLAGRHLLLSASIHASLGRSETALDGLRSALAAGLPYGVELHSLPALRSLISEPEFLALLRPRG